MARRPPRRRHALTSRLSGILAGALALAACACGRGRSLPAGETLAIVRVLKTSRLPDPVKSPYKDCLLVMKVSVERVEAGAPRTGDVLVALWGFRDRAVEAAAAFEAGTRIRVRLKPWAEVPKEIERIQQVDDVGEYALPLYFAVEAASAEATRAGFGSPDEAELAAARRRAMEADLTRLSDLRSRHGGDYAAWRRELEGVRGQILGKMSASGGLLESKGQRLAAPDFPRVDDPELSFEPAVTMLSRLRDELRRRQTDLVVVPIPWKGEAIAPLFVPGVPDDGVLVPARVELLEALLRADIEVIDLFPVWRAGVLAGEPVYYEAVDVHPADRGTQLMSRAIAERLGRYHFPRSESFATRRIEFSPPKSETTFPGGMRLAATQVLRADGLALENTDVSPVLVIGDCYVTGPGPFGAPDAGPVAHLAHDLGFLPTALEQAGGAAQMMVTLARKGPAYLEGRRVCVFIGFVQYFFVPPSVTRRSSYSWIIVELPRPSEKTGSL